MPNIILSVLRALALAVTVLACAGARAQVSAELLPAAATVQPGGSLTVALKLSHDEPWHTYWINPGTGVATKLIWSLPPGWTADAIDWPTPSLMFDKAGNPSGHGYGGELYLPVTIHAPASAKAGEQVTLPATAKWLMCDEVCIPGSEDLEAVVKVSPDAPAPVAAVTQALARQSMPKNADGWRLAASREGLAYTVYARAPAAISAPHFFPLDASVPHTKAQVVKGEGERWTIALPALEAPDGGAAQALPKLAGVLGYKDAAGAWQGVRVDATPVTESQAQAAMDGVAITGSQSDGGDDAAALAGDAGAAASQLSLGVLLLALLGGLILNLMPCVFPVLGIKVMGFVNHAGSERSKVTLHGLAFTAGVLISFWALAALLAALRAGGEQLGWGFQLQSPVFVFILAFVMLVFALNLSGLFEVGLRATGVGGELQMKEGVSGSFFSGVLATVVATPCSAPFLAPALGTALALPTAQAFVVFTCIGIGLALPYLLLSIFPQLVNKLPRPGAWMETFKQVMAFPLYATVGYLVWVLAGQLSDKGLLNVLLALTGIAFAGWLYGHYTAPGAAATRVRVGSVASLLVLLGALAYGWPHIDKTPKIDWQPWSPERVTQLQQAGRPIYVDFTARWCATCQVNKNVVFGSTEVQDYFAANQVAAVRADWTNADPAITAELAKWKRSAIPFNLVYLPGQDPQPLPELLTPRIVLDALKNQR